MSRSRTCHVCGTSMLGANGHHVLPQSRGGRDGPQVVVCASDHTSIHLAARAIVGGRSTSRALGHLPPEQRERADALAQIAALAERHGIDNPHPQLVVALDDPIYMRALDQFKIERGFSSRDAAVNALLREMARGYGLFEPAPGASNAPKFTRIRDFRGSGPR